MKRIISIGIALLSLIAAMGFVDASESRDSDWICFVTANGTVSLPAHIGVPPRPFGGGIVQFRFRSTRVG